MSKCTLVLIKCTLVLSKCTMVRVPGPNDGGVGRRQGQNQKGNSSQPFVHAFGRISMLREWTDFSAGESGASAANSASSSFSVTLGVVSKASP
jgi:hypothetical protein